MAPAVGVALAQPPLVVLGVFLLIGLGMAAPLLALSFAPALARTLPKPGPWMSTFRQALAFPMFLTAIWLLWVLAGQAGNDAVILTIAAATGLGFAIWLAGKIGGGSVGRVVAGALIVAALLGPSLLFGLRPPAPPAQAAVATALAEEAWSPQRVAELRSEGRVVFVDFTARWCVTCQVNERGPLASDAVREAFSSSNVAFLKADWTNRDDIIAEELARHGRAGVPLYLVYPADGGEPEILPQLLTPSLVVAAIKKAAGAVETTDTSNLTGETL
jgi:thiol:disulfide interchange protein